MSSVTFTRILLACNDSQNSEFVFQFAAKLAWGFNAKLYVSLYDKSKHDLAAIFNKIEHEIVMRPELSIKEIQHTVIEKDIDLVITTVKQGDSPNGLLTIKDVCHFIDHVNKPVLTIPGNYSTESVNTIVAPIDTSHETRQKGPYVIAMSRKLNCEVKILAVSSDKGKDALSTICNYSRQVSNKMADEGTGSEIETIVGGNITNLTLDYAKKVNAGLIIIMTEQEVNFKSFFSGKYSEQMIKFSPIPVLSVCPIDLVVSEARI